MFRRLRARADRAPRTFAALALALFIAPAVAGPLAYCLHGDDASTVVAAAAHCETMAKDAGSGLHLPAVDDAAGPVASSASAGQSTLPPLAPFGGWLPRAADLHPAHLVAYGGAAPDPASMRHAAGAIAGRSVRLLI